MAQPNDAPLDDLNPYSQRFAAQLFRAHPEWRGLATPPPWPGADRGVLYVKLESPVDQRRVLSIITDGDEITVGFGEHGWHAHFGGWAGDDEATNFAEALEMIDGLLTEAVVLVQSYHGDEPGWSSVIAAADSADFAGADRLEVLVVWEPGCYAVPHLTSVGTAERLKHPVSCQHQIF
jgi:hypothetical protein